MLYSEFVEGTGCKDNEHNYKVYKNLEVMYMNSDMSKAEVYEYGKKLVDNSKSEAELKVEAEIKAEIEYLKDELNKYKGYVNNDTWMLEFWKEDGNKEMANQYRNAIRHWKEEIKTIKARIRACKWVIAS